MISTLSRAAAQAAATLLTLALLAAPAWAQQPLTFYGQSLPTTASTVNIVARNANTTYTVTRLDNSAVLGSGTIAARLGVANVAVPADLPIKVVTSDVALAHLGYDCCNLGGQLVLPTADGVSRVGRDFILYRPVAAGASNVLVIGAIEDATITIRDAANAVIATNTLTAGTLWTEPAGVVAGTGYSVTSTGDISIQIGSGNGFAVAPPIDSPANSCNNDSGLEHFFYVNNWSLTNLPYVAAFNDGNVAADVLIFNLTTGSDYTLTVPANGVAAVQVPEQGFYQAISDSPITIVAGDTEGTVSANPIDNLGDDTDQYAGSNQGRRYRLRSQLAQTRIFSREAGNVVTVNGAPTTLGADGRLSVAAQQDLIITSTLPIVVQTIGGSGSNDWGLFMRPIQRLDTDGDGLTDVQEGGGCQSTALDNNSDGVADFLQPLVPGPLTLTVTAPLNNSATNDPFPPFEGSTLPNSSVMVTINGVVETGTSDATGAFSFLWTAGLADGVYSAAVAVMDPYGRSILRTVTFTVDTADPAITITTPADGALLNDRTPTIAGAFSDSSAVSISVAFVNDAGTTVYTGAATANGGAWTLTPPNANALPDGDYLVTATITDAAGNTASELIAISIDATAPVIAITAPANNTRTADDTPDLSGTLSEDAELTYTVDSGAAQSIGATASGAWASEVGPLADGSRTIRVTATDAAGNASTAQVIIIVDTTPPAVAITAPANDANTNAAAVSVAGTAEAGAAISVALTNDQGMMFSAMVTAIGGTWTAPFANLPDGEYEAFATATDSVGNANMAGPTTFTIDRVAPTASVTAPAAGSRSNDTTPSFAGLATDDRVGVQTVTITVTNSAGATVYTGTATLNGADWTLTVPNNSALADGTYNVRATARDLAGNQVTSAPVSFIVDITPPAVAITQPAANARTNDITPTLSGTAEAGATMLVEVRNSANAVVFSGAPAVAGTTWSVDSGALTEGAYTVTARATDASGNSATAGPRAFTIDLTPPTVSIAAPAAGVTTNDNTVAISGAAETGAAVLVEVFNAQSQLAYSATVTAAASAWSTTTTALPDGNYTILVTATDVAGNPAGAGPRQFVVDTTPPPIAITAPAAGAVTNDTTPTISGTSSAGAAISVRIDGGAALMTTADNTGAWTLNAPTLAAGARTAVATATDAAGNVSQPASVTFTIDTSAPNITILAPANNSITRALNPAYTGQTDAGLAVTITVRDAQNMILSTGMVTADAAGNWTFTPAQPLPGEGLYTVSATTANAAGTPASAQSSFTVDTSITLAITGLPDGDFTNNSQPTIVGTAEVGATVTVTYIDAMGVQVSGTVQPDAQGGWSFVPATALADGVYTVRVSGVDQAGNMVTLPDLTITIDTAAPSIAIATPADGAILGAATTVTGTSEANVMITVRITDAAGATSFEDAVVADANGMWVVTPTMLVDGAYTATATATDRAGNEADASVTFSVDSAMPSVSITAPADMSATNDATLGVAGFANPNIAVAVTVRDAAGMTVATATATADAQGMWTLQLTDALVDGAYEVTATVTLPNGRTATQTNAFTVDTMAPAIALLTPAAGLTSQSAVVVSGTAEPGATVNVIIDGMTVSTITADAQGAWTYTADPALADGAHTISAETTDAAGNPAAATPVEITVDTIAPALAVIAPAADEVVTVSTPTISGTAEPGATVTVTVDGQVIGTATAGADGMWSIVPSAALAEGEREIVVVAADAAGNMSPPVTVTITIDATPSAPVAITSPVNNTQVDGPSLTVTGTGEPGAMITVFVDNAQAAQTTVNPDGTWSATVPVTAGQRTIRADQGDASASVLVTVRGAAPVDPDDDDDLVLTGGPGCASAPGAPAAPTSLLGLLGLLGLGLIRRPRSFLCCLRSATVRRSSGPSRCGPWRGRGRRRCRSRSSRRS